MPLPVEIARQLTEEQIAFVKRSGLKAEVLEPGFVRLYMPLHGNQNHIGSMYAGALFTLAEIPGGALFLTSFDAQRFYPIIREMNLRFRRPATVSYTHLDVYKRQPVAVAAPSRSRAPRRSSRPKPC